MGIFVQRSLRTTSQDIIFSAQHYQHKIIYIYINKYIDTDFNYIYLYISHPTKT